MHQRAGAVAHSRPCIWPARAELAGAVRAALLWLNRCFHAIARVSGGGGGGGDAGVGWGWLGLASPRICVKSSYLYILWGSR